MGFNIPAEHEQTLRCEPGPNYDIRNYLKYVITKNINQVHFNALISQHDLTWFNMDKDSAQKVDNMLIKKSKFIKFKN